MSVPERPSAVAPPHIERGTPEFRRTNLALFAAGFSTFALMYCVQPLLPAFADHFHVGAAGSSLSLSLTTGVLAFAMPAASSLSEALGRKSVMVASLVASALLTLACAAAPSWGALLVLRALAGLALSGLPAVAMAYLGEEVDPRSLGLAMGLYIGGSAIGGMSGRLLTSVIVDFFSWRVAVAGVGAVGLACALAFWRSLPPSRRFQPRPLSARSLAASFAAHLQDPGLRWLFLVAFLLMGSFVAVYNYIGFRLLAPPYNLSQAVIGMIFAVYLVGVASSALIGDLAGRLGRRKVLWAVALVALAGALMTAASNLAVIVAGVAVLTFGFFGAHSVASSWVGRRARGAKAQAASLYLFFYYMGSSVVGAAGGLFWTHWGWPGVVALVGTLLAAAAAVGVRLAFLPPLQQTS